MLGGLPGRPRMCSFSFHSLAFLTFKITLSDASLPLLLSFGFYAVKIPLSADFPPLSHEVVEVEQIGNLSCILQDAYFFFFVSS